MKKLDWLAFVLGAFALSLCASLEAGDKFLRASLKGKYDLDALYSYPIQWGVAPSSVAWSPEGRNVAFLWNQEGGRSLDLYLARIPGGEITRVTDIRQWRKEREGGDSDRYDPGVRSFVWSPDGGRLALSYAGDLFLVSPSGADLQRIVHTGASESQPRFSPDGKLLGFIKEGNVWALDLEAAALFQLTRMPPAEGVRIADYGWSPGAEQLYVTVTDTSHFQKEAMPDFTLDHVVPNLTPFRYHRDDVARSRVGILAGSGGDVRWVSLGSEGAGVAWLEWSPGIGSVQWFPDGSRLLVNHSRAGTRDWHLVAVDPRTLEKTTLATDVMISRYTPGSITFGPGGRNVLIPSYRDGWLHLYSIPAGGGPLQQLTRGEWDLQVNINSPRFLDAPPKGDRIFFTSSAVHPLEKHLFSVAPEGGEPQRLSEAPGTYTPYASPDGRYVVVDYSSAETPNDLHLIDTEAPRRMKRLTSSPLPGFADVRLVKPRYDTFTNPKDGVEVHYRLLVPPGFSESAGKRYPVVFTHMYSDEGKNGWSRYRPFEAFLAAEMSYLVVSLDGRGSSGHGREFADGRYPRESTKDVEDHLEAAKYMKTLPYVDPGRVGCWGKSYGGDLALMNVFQEPGVFDTSISIQPVTRRPRGIFKPENLQAHLLLIHSSLDTTVYFREMALVLQMLVDAGKYADFWLYPKEDHSLALLDETFKDTMKRIAKYFEDHWGIGPEPLEEASP